MNHARQCTAHSGQWRCSFRAVLLPVLCVDQDALEQQLQALRVEEKRLVGQLADKGVAPEAIGPGLLQAMLNLKDTPTTG